MIHCPNIGRKREMDREMEREEETAPVFSLTKDITLRGSQFHKPRHDGIRFELLIEGEDSSDHHHSCQDDSQCQVLHSSVDPIDKEAKTRANPEQDSEAANQVMKKFQPQRGSLWWRERVGSILEKTSFSFSFCQTSLEVNL